MAKVIAFANHKGGVGKSTSAACIGAALALKGRRTLLVDLDAQQNLTFCLMGATEPESSVYDSIMNGEHLPALKMRENLYLSPATLELTRAEMALSSMMMRETRLKVRIDEISEKFDYILLDCPPSLGTLTTNALVAADKVYIPLTPEAFPLSGLALIDDVVEEVRRMINPRLHIGGIIITRYNNRVLNRQVVDVVSGKYGEEATFSTKIRENILLAEMPLTKKTIFEYAPESNGAADYAALTDEIIAREEGKIGKQNTK